MKDVQCVDVKICTRCNLEKPLFAFSKQKDGKNGFRANCKECEKKYREINREWILKNQRQYYQDNKQKILEKVAANSHKRRTYDRERYQKIKSDPIKRAEYLKKVNRALRRHNLKHPNRRKARFAVTRAIEFGKIIRPDTCSSCNRVCVPEAHHDSYDIQNWLNVRWLCKQCHCKHHRKYPDQPK